jgi:hypothetical protein
MLPAPPSSCAGWWFAQLWRRLLSGRHPVVQGWRVHANEAGELTLIPEASGEAGGEEVHGSYPPSVELGNGADRSLVVARHWPGEDGMRHMLRLTWHVGQMAVYPGDWSRARSPESEAESVMRVPWPHSLTVAAYGLDHQSLDSAVIEVEGERVHWQPPRGVPRSPYVDVPSSVVGAERTDETELILAGLPLRWHIELDREAWPIWRRLNGNAMLAAVGGPWEACPRHGVTCPWTTSGRSRS